MEGDPSRASREGTVWAGHECQAKGGSWHPTSGSCGRPARPASSPPQGALCVLVRSAGAHACLHSVVRGAGAAQDKDENTLAKAYFRWSAEGWNATTKDGESWPSSGELGYLKSSDDDDSLWYYTASPDFLGETFCCALGRATTFVVRTRRLRPWCSSMSLCLILMVCRSLGCSR